MNVAVSVVIPCFNDGRFLPEAVQSAEQCKQGCYEIIVVNDGSTDPATLDVLSDIQRRGHQVLHQANCGLARARNRGISAARGRYILPLDADNRIRPAYVERGVEILDRNPGVDVVYGDAEFFGNKTGRNRVPEFNLSRLLEWNYIDACAVLRKSAWERGGGYDEGMPTQGFEDWDLWCRIALSGGGFRHIDEVLFDYRVRKDSMSVGMSRADRVGPVLRHIRTKRIEISIGDYHEAYQSWDAVVHAFRKRPAKTLISLVVRAFFPSIYASRQNAKR